MSALTPINAKETRKQIDDAYARVSKLSVNEAKAELGHWIFQTIDSIIQLAAIIRYLTEKGEDVANLGSFWIRLYVKVSEGLVLPQLIQRFQLTIGLLQKFSRFPLCEQELLAGGVKVPLLSMKDGTPLLVDPLDMSPDQQRQAFAKDHIRPINEQAAFMDQERRKASKKIPENVGPFKLDKERGGATFTAPRGSFVSLDEMSRAVAALRKVCKTY